jgi:hypothetical protein
MTSAALRPDVLSRLTVALIVSSLLLLARPALADRPTSTEVRATLTVTVIHAHNARAGVDPKLASLTDYLSKSFTRYKGFEHLGVHTTTLAVKDKKSSKLPDGKTLTLEFRGLAKGFVKVHLELDGLKTTVDVRDGGLFFQAGRVYKGGILVLAIGARTGTSSATEGVDTARSGP